MITQPKILDAFTLGDVVFSSKYNLPQDDEDIAEGIRPAERWISVRYAGYGADGSLSFQWSQGGFYYTGAGTMQLPHRMPEQTMRVEIAPIVGNHCVATWRTGSGPNAVKTFHYSLGEQGELLEVASEDFAKTEEPRGFGFRAL